MVYTILNFKHLGIIASAIKHQIYEIPLFSFNRASDFAFLAMSECFSFYDNLFLTTVRILCICFITTVNMNVSLGS